VTYVFGAIGGPVRPRLPRAMPKLPGSGPVRLIAAGRGQWLLVSTVPESKFGESQLAGAISDFDWVADCGTAHHGVIEAVHRTIDVIPFRLFTIFSTDERASSRLAASRAKIAAALKRVKGREEWVLRMAPAPVTSASAPGAVSGASYLAAKAAALKRGGAIPPAQKRAAAALLRDLGRLTDQSYKRTDADGPALLVDAAFLVKRSKQKAFVSAVSRGTKALAAQGSRVSLTGPWPPYSFVTFPLTSR
jgi:hypothetical protein